MHFFSQVFLLVVGSLMGKHGVWSQSTPFFNLDDLNGENGLVVTGLEEIRRASISSGGDINGDGLDDFVVGLPIADSFAGQAYVVFGSTATHPPSFDSSTIDGTNGFEINGLDSSTLLGSSVSSGDVSGDGIDDLIIGSPAVSSSQDAGKVFVIFGSDNGFPPVFELAQLTGVNGYVLEGPGGGDKTGAAVASGDVNGDGISDLIIGNTVASPPGSVNIGQVYVVFGSNATMTPMPSQFNLTDVDGTNGFVINGINDNDQIGYAVDASGDQNGDGIADIVIGAPSADTPTHTRAGQIYVIYGSNATTSSPFGMNELDGTNGFTLNGFYDYGGAGHSIASGGDVNGDEIDDLIIGAPFALPLYEEIPAGQVYVLFGSAAWESPAFNLTGLNGANGFILNGIETYDNTGRSVSSSGDINGDGIHDIIVGADVEDLSGKVYVMFGSKEPRTSPFSLANLNGTNGLAFTRGIVNHDAAGYSVSSGGDLNRDGFNDLVIGAPLAGRVYVIYGNSTFLSEVPLLPTNDLCANAKVVEIGSTTTGSTLDATAPDGIEGTFCGFSADVAGRAVWYAVMGNGNRLVASTCNAASFDTSISVYNGGCFTNASDGAQGCVAGNDDIFSRRCNAGTSEIEFDSYEQVQYLILVHGYGGERGNIDLSIGDTGFSSPPVSPDASLSPTTMEASSPPSTVSPTTRAPSSQLPTTSAPLTAFPTTQAPSTQLPTTQHPSTAFPTTHPPSTQLPTSQAPSTDFPTTQLPMTQDPSTAFPTTQAPSTQLPTTQAPSTAFPITQTPSTQLPTTQTPITLSPIRKHHQQFFQQHRLRLQVRLPLQT